ncbi:hypothetical protein Tco_1192051 [Tanacetum coccineum]
MIMMINSMLIPLMQYDGQKQTGSLETRNEKMQTPIPSPHRSPRIDLSSDKNVSQEMTVSVSPTLATTYLSKSKRISSKYTHIPGALRRICKHQDIMIKQMEKKFVTNRDFQAIYKNFDNVLHDVIPKIALNATINIIEDNLPKFIVEVVMKKRDTFQETIPALISKEFIDHVPNSSTATSSSADLEHQLYLKMKRSLQDQADDPELWEVLKRKRMFEKSSALSHPCRIDTFCGSDHDDHQKNDAPPEGEKRAERRKTSKSSKSARGSSSKQPAQRSETYNGNTEEKSYILLLHKINAAPNLEEDLEEKMKRWVKKEFNTFNEEAQLSIQHWKDSWHKRLYKINHIRVRANPEEYFFNHRIVEVIRVTTEQQHGLDFLEQIIVMRENDKPYSFSKADFKYLNKNFIEDLYYLFRNKKVDYRENTFLNSLMTFIRSRLIWDRVCDFQLGIESYLIRVNLTAPTLIFSGIEACD